VTCHRNYFYQKCFTNDGQRLIFGAEFGPGTDWNYHLLDLRSGECQQLTDQPEENTFGGFLSPDDRHLYFVRGQRQLIRLDLATRAEDVAYVVPEGWVGYGTWVANSACTKMAGIEVRASDWFPLTDWQKFREMFFRKPRCRLISIDLRSGERSVIHEVDLWLGHPQYRPFDDNTVAFCHEGNHDLVDARMWFINEDGSQLRCGKQHAEGESCTHEFWVPDGSAMIYVSYLRGQSERWIRALDPVTLQDRPLTVMPPCSHLMSNHDGTLIVGDGSATPVDVNDRGGHKIQSDPYLHVFDLRAGTRRTLARHDSSWGVYKGDRQVTHPHPSFSPDQRQVLFSCDKAGEPGLFLVDL
jgi:oligogalacturonide lyase